jgi:hypothetical protein
MKLVRISALGLGVALASSLLAVPESWAHGSSEEQAQCVHDARDESRLCKALCKDDLRTDKDLCAGFDHDCADACRAGEDVCRHAPISEVDMCKETNCEDPLEDAQDLCREQFPSGTPGRDDCIDAARLVAFQCRDECRDGVRDDLKLCRKAFKACLNACPPAAE